MAIFRFRAVFEEQDEVFRDIDIKSTQTLEDFHSAILIAINFEDKYDASFFISDEMWRKGDEITLKSDDDSAKLMKKCILASLIDDPHQRFLYVHDPKSPWELCIELMKIVPEKDGVDYPICSKSVGEAPKKNKIAPLPTDFDDDDDDFDDDDLEDDDDAYNNAMTEELDMDDLNNIEVQDSPDASAE